MRRLFWLVAASALVSIALSLPQGAGAMTVGTVSGIQNALAQTSLVESVVRVCRQRSLKGGRTCYIDRSRPPTVCHHITTSSRRDCY